MQPLSQVLGTLDDQLDTPADVDRLVDKLAPHLRPHGPVIDELQRLSNRLEKTGDGLPALLLNPKVMCEGDLAQLDRELTALELDVKPMNRKSHLRDALMIGDVHAATKSAFLAVYLSFDWWLPPAMPLPNSIVVTALTNFAGDGGFYLSVGRVWSTTGAAASVSAGVHIFPYADAGDFDGMGSLGVELSFGPTGEKWEELLRKAGGWKWVIPDSFTVTGNPLFWTPDEGAEKDDVKSFPLGFGISKSIRGPEPGDTSSVPSPSGTIPIPTPRPRILDASFSADWTFALRPPD